MLSSTDRPEQKTILYLRKIRSVEKDAETIKCKNHMTFKIALYAHKEPQLTTQLIILVE